MNIQKISLSDMHEAYYNPRVDLQPTDQEYKNILNSINEFGYVEPIIWNKRTGNIVGGHQRYKIMKASGVKVAVMGQHDYRLHHRVSWNNTIPMIIRQEYKK